jgi:hypothetical protein
MKHEIIKNQAQGKDNWVITCSCGKSWNCWRWLAQERFNEHLPVEDNRPQVLSYEEMQGDPLARYE